MKGNESTRPSTYVCVLLQLHKEEATMSTGEEEGDK